MPYSLGLTLYGLAHRGEMAEPVERPPRPSGRLVWLHAAALDDLPAIARLAARLGVRADAPSILVTAPGPVDLAQTTLAGPPFGQQPGTPPPKGPIRQTVPLDTLTDVRLFLDHWRPDATVLTGGELRPALIREAADRGIPLLLLDAGAPHILRGRDGWWPGLIRSLLGTFRAVHAVDEVAARALRRGGAQPDAVRVAGRMEHPSAALTCTEAERASLAHLLTTRPVWFVAGLPEAEEEAVIEAHRAALRLAHRLLLIVAPQDPGRVGPLAARMQVEENWLVARRSAEEEPDAEVQAYITDGCTEFGLWYRLAPVTFLGGSLSTLGCLRDPMEAAALGSAILHGPRAGRHAAALARLGAARAAVGVACGPSLGAALGEMLAPDRVARLAQAAWTVTSDGAETTDRALAAIADAMAHRT